ncbi:hypothetical protein [Ulvibacter antarcticus]|uniref:Adhesin n=1 Tax=Ulvibacter antarcticus TaxID=442714 RepID=A0A3L9Z6G5_9FLAO|nr:hypothetical protein [Ulvibacter antarcticus]RMA65865.1 hypothetical protein BXY75_0279 [Ulvibacter antarcticus]
MLKKFVFILLISAFASEGFAQKILEREWDAEGVEKLFLRCNSVYQISITSEKTDKILVHTEVAGENYEQLLLATELKNDKLTIETSYAPFFKPENDKLAAHKIMAIEMRLVIPEGLQVSIESKLASVEVEGSYRFLSVALEEGNCELQNFKGDASLQTKKGDIIVFARTDVSGTGLSTNGTVENHLDFNGSLLIEAESIYGNIRLLQTK